MVKNGQKLLLSAMYKINHIKNDYVSSILGMYDWFNSGKFINAIYHIKRQN